MWIKSLGLLKRFLPRKVRKILFVSYLFVIKCLNKLLKNHNMWLVTEYFSSNVEMFSIRFSRIGFPKILRLDKFYEQAYPPLLKMLPFDDGFDLLRIGSNLDGSYLVPNDLAGIEKCFSVGSGSNGTFEEALISSFNINSIILDAPESKPYGLSKSQIYHAGWLGKNTNQETISLSDFVSLYADPEEDLLLQIDIEGSEWTTLLDVAPEEIARFRIIVIELHYLNLVTDSNFLFNYLSPLMDKLGRNHVIVHAHANNCSPPYCVGALFFPPVIELTFHRKDRISTNKDLAPRLDSHPLDILNVPDSPIVNIDWIDILDKKL